MISYAGVGLNTPEPEQAEYDKTWLDHSWIEEFAIRTWPGIDLIGLGFRGYIPKGPVLLNTLRWPRDASRFAVGHFLATTHRVDAIREVIYGGGSTYISAPLVMDDGSNEITTNMWMLPPRPFNQVNVGSDELYMITLVDDRFFWWFKSANINVIGGVTTWTSMYTSIGSALGVSISVDTIPAAYLKPSNDFNSNYRALPVLLDAVAYSVGQRIIRKLDGTVVAQNPANAQAQLETNLADLEPNICGGIQNLLQ